jgi:hypothetical protein
MEMKGLTKLAEAFENIEQKYLRSWLSGESSSNRAELTGDVSTSPNF